MESDHYFLAGHAGNPDRAKLCHLARSGSESQRRIQFILPAQGAINTIKVNMALLLWQSQYISVLVTETVVLMAGSPTHWSRYTVLSVLSIIAQNLGPKRLCQSWS